MSSPTSIIPHPVWTAMHEVLRERQLLKKSHAESDPATLVERDDFLLHYFLQFLTKETFLSIPLVSRRWGSFRNDGLWEKRCRRDWGVDISTLSQKPETSYELYQRLHTAYKETIRRSQNICMLGKKDMTIRLPMLMRERMFSF